MKFRLTVEVDVTRAAGKNESRESLAETIRLAIEDAAPSEIFGAEGGEFTVNDWVVTSENDPPKPAKKINAKGAKCDRAWLDRSALLTWVLAVATDAQLDAPVPSLAGRTGRELVTMIQRHRKDDGA